ncbi:MAG: LytR/AlgR family response regulator transcription factor [archaeon]
MAKILIIEDDKVVRKSLTELLETNDYKVFTASDGFEGVQLAKDIKPNLIICDIMMPKLTGFGVIECLKKESIFSSTPFIFLTAKAELSDIRNGMESGADDYITKPFRAITLLKAIETRLEKFALIQQKVSEAEEPQESKKREVLTENERLFIKVNNKPEIIIVGEILFIKAEGEYSTIHLISGKKYMVRRLLKDWEEQLPQHVFLRIHRATIINLNYVEKIEKWVNRSYVMLLKTSNEKFIISNRYARKIKSHFL